MPLTPKEKMERFRKKVKEDLLKYERILEKDRLRKLNKRQEMSLNELILLRQRNVEAIKKHRKSANLKKVSSAAENKSAPIVKFPFKSPQSLGKAKHRVLNNLPNSPNKWAEVIKQIASDISDIPPPCEVQTSTEFADVASSLNTKTVVLHCPAGDIGSSKTELDMSWINRVPVPQMISVHRVTTVAQYVIDTQTYVLAEKTRHYVLGNGNCDAVSADDVPTEQVGGMLTIVNEHWYAVYWREYDYWIIGRALSTTDTGRYKFQFNHQTTQDVNQFKDGGDVDEADKNSIFYELTELPKPLSSTRTTELKISDADLKTIFSKFLQLSI
ncbi:hypothetical protein LOTGIDRAFT_163124 [Lottia gigantea]|uniref:Uncharacterized protein n=1 Tax=Lottia gigantea TaxID=225164 RepID=V4AEI8_LOTGI|nr:hypothetical protein LOTGIDRAFT_163124 [Lottia gigantea]ESO91766.1 hypothetical protein LOTGIDRAFT_163124 [Lottia gigantea]